MKLKIKTSTLRFFSQRWIKDQFGSWDKHVFSPFLFSWHFSGIQHLLTENVFHASGLTMRISLPDYVCWISSLAPWIPFSDLTLLILHMTCLFFSPMEKAMQPVLFLSPWPPSTELGTLLVLGNHLIRLHWLKQGVRVLVSLPYFLCSEIFQNAFYRTLVLWNAPLKKSVVM